MSSFAGDDSVGATSRPAAGGELNLTPAEAEALVAGLAASSDPVDGLAKLAGAVNSVADLELGDANLVGDLVAVAEALDDALAAGQAALDRLDRIIAATGGRRNG